MKGMKRTIKAMAEGAIRAIARIFRIQLFWLGYDEIGVIRSGAMEATGEKEFIARILPAIVGADKPVFVDAGANIGEYSTLLRRSFPRADIYCFEPNPPTFEVLQTAAKASALKTFRKGLSSESGTAMLMGDDAHPTSGSTSLYGKEIGPTFNRVHDYSKPVERRVELTTLDKFATTHGIDHIDFLKLDIEGHEFEALKGASGLISRGAIGAVQFEVNRLNVISRVFMRDFYALLSGWHFYRIHRSGKRVPLGSYSEIHEIFRIHNIFAVSPKSGIEEKLCTFIKR
jgi:FkbM family methyltransferase